MLVSAAIRLNPQSAIRQMQNRFKPSKLELLGPRNGLKFGPRSSRGLRSVPLLFWQIPNLATKSGPRERP
eukprot:14659362-Alexandrium_andersonii.AAC.1